METSSPSMSMRRIRSKSRTRTCSNTEQAKIIANNIRSGVTLLGINGSTNVVNTNIASGGAAAGDIMNGKKAYVNGELITGSATVPTVSQDSTTKVLSIS